MAEYYLDVDYSDLTLTGTLTFTNGSSTVTGSGTAFTTELAVGDYIKSTDATYGGTWYKVSSITDAITLTLNVNFFEDTHSATAVRNRGDGSQTNPFCHLAQYTTDTVRSPGDILYCQNGQTMIPRWTINTDDDGAGNNPIYIIGSDWKNLGVNDYFDINAEDQNNLYNGVINFSSDLFWILENLKFMNRTVSIGYGVINFTDSLVRLKNCYFYNCNHCLDAYNMSGGAICVDCIFDTITNTINRSGRVILINPTFLNNINCIANNYTTIINGEIPTTTSDTFNLNYPFNNIVLKGAINTNNITVSYNNLHAFVNMFPMFIPFSIIIDNENKIICRSFIMEYDSSTIFSSGNDAIKIIPNNDNHIGTYFPVQLCEWELDNVTAGTYTIQVLVKSFGLTVFPTADELYVEVEYLDNATTPLLGFAQSTEVIAANDTETTLSTSFTSAQDGKVRIKVMYGFSCSDTSPIIYIENGFSIS